MSAEPAGQHQLRIEHRLQTPRAAGAVGLVFSVLFVVSMVFIRQAAAPAVGKA